MAEHCDGLDIELCQGILKITLNNFQRKNAIKLSMFVRITEELNNASRNDEVKAVYMTGAGNDYFSSGNDLGNLMQDGDPFELLEKGVKVFQEFVAALINLNKLMIVGVNGPAVGAAVSMLGLADLVYACSKATFQTPFTQLGLVAEGCSSYTFPR